MDFSSFPTGTRVSDPRVVSVSLIVVFFQRRVAFFPKNLALEVSVFDKNLVFVREIEVGFWFLEESYTLNHLKRKIFENSDCVLIEGLL